MATRQQRREASAHAKHCRALRASRGGGRRLMGIALVVGGVFSPGTWLFPMAQENLRPLAASWWYMP